MWKKTITIINIFEIFVQQLILLNLTFNLTIPYSLPYSETEENAYLESSPGLVKTHNAYRISFSKHFCRQLLPKKNIIIVNYVLCSLFLFFANITLFWYCILEILNKTM